MGDNIRRNLQNEERTSRSTTLKKHLNLMKREKEKKRKTKTRELKWGGKDGRKRKEKEKEKKKRRGKKKKTSIGKTEEDMFLAIECFFSNIMIKSLFPISVPLSFCKRNSISWPHFFDILVSQIQSK